MKKGQRMGPSVMNWVSAPDNSDGGGTRLKFSEKMLFPAKVNRALKR